jgi:hypothetical protein
MTNTSRFTLSCIGQLPSNYVLFTHSNTGIHKIKKKLRAFVSLSKEGKEPRHLGRNPKNKERCNLLQSTRKAVAIAVRVAGTKTA